MDYSKQSAPRKNGILSIHLRGLDPVGYQYLWERSVKEETTPSRIINQILAKVIGEKNGVRKTKRKTKTKAKTT
jgi:hypothetical protein